MTHAVKDGLVELLKFLPYDAGGQMYTRLSVGDMLEIFGVVPFGPLGGGLVMGDVRRDPACSAVLDLHHRLAAAVVGSAVRR